MDIEKRLAAIERRLAKLEQCGTNIKKERDRPLPHDWQPRDEDLEWCKETYPHVNGEHEAACFKDYWISRGAKKVQWDHAFRNWCRKAATQVPATTLTAGAGRSPSRAADTAARNSTKRDRVLDKLATLFPNST